MNVNGQMQKEKGRCLIEEKIGGIKYSKMGQIAPRKWGKIVQSMRQLHKRYIENYLVIKAIEKYKF